MEKQSTSENWQWWAGDNDEHYSVGPCATREEAIAEAVDTDVGYDETPDGPVNHLHLCEALMYPPLRLANYLNLRRIIEDAEEQVEEMNNPNGDRTLFDASADQLSDLAERLKRACDEWQQAQGLVFNAYTFQKTRNLEHGTFGKAAPATWPAAPWKGLGRE